MLSPVCRIRALLCSHDPRSGGDLLLVASRSLVPVPVFVTMLQDPIIQITVIFLFVQDDYKPILLNGKKC